MRGVSDHGQSSRLSPSRGARCGLPLAWTGSALPFDPLSRLNTRPVPSPVNASPPPLRMTTHDSGPVWSATPSPCDSFIHYPLPADRHSQALEVSRQKVPAPIAIGAGLKVLEEKVPKPVPPEAGFGSSVPTASGACCRPHPGLSRPPPLRGSACSRRNRGSPLTVAKHAKGRMVHGYVKDDCYRVTGVSSRGQTPRDRYTAKPKNSPAKYAMGG